LHETAQGEMGASGLFHLLLAATAILLVQCLLWAELIHRPGVISVIGLAMTAGGIAAWASQAPVVTPATAMLGLAGCWVALASAWPDVWTHPHPFGAARRRAPGAWYWTWRGLVACLAAGGASALACGFRLEALAAAGCLGLALLGAGVLGAPGRKLFLAAGAIVTASAAWALARYGAAESWQLAWPRGPLGEGAEVFSRLHTSASGLTILGGATGWVGLGGLAIVLVWSVAWLWRAGGACSSGSALRRAGWTAATLTVGAAVAMPGGLFVPTTVLASGLTLGLMPAAFGARVAGRPAWVLTAVVAGALALLGVSASGGLARWSALSMGGADAWPHVITGFLVAMTLAWWWGARRTGLGLLAVAVAVLAGGAGELAQEWFTASGGQWHDWGFHALGCLPAALVLVLGRYARRCELPDARSPDLPGGPHRLGR
ncbi:MAG: hypothetical protein NTV86_09325, partial [Planctomycetota bacterium]|nr:hypothetical protein [Planctomycetota bacterium]